MSVGWYKIELTDALRERPLPDAVFQVRHAFRQRYGITFKKPEGAVLLANFELDNPDQVLPPVLYYYLSPVTVEMLHDVLDQYGARACAQPSIAETHFIEGDGDYFSSLLGDTAQSKAAAL